MSLLSEPVRFRFMMTWIRDRARGFGWNIAAIALSGIMSAASMLLFVWATKHIVDIATGRSASGWGAAVCLLAAALTGRLFFNVISRRAGVMCSTRFSNALRSGLFSRLMNARWTGRERFHSSDAINRLASDVGTVATMVSSVIPGMVVTVVELLSAFAFLCVLNARMACVLVLIMPFALVVSKLYMKRSHRLTHEIRNEESALQRIMQENLQHRVLISSLRLTETTVADFARVQNRFYSLVMSRNDIALFAGTAVTAGFMLGYTVAFLYCAHGLSEGTVTFGAMTAFLQLVAQVQRPVVDLAGRVPAFVSTSVAVERLDEIMKLPLEHQGDDVRLSGAVGLSMTGVGFRYPDSDSDVITCFTHDFRPGAITVVAGETGAGKTTLLMLMLGLLEPSRGTVELYGGDGVRTPSSPLSRCNLVYVPQGNSLLSGTVRSNLLLGNPDATESEMATALKAAAADFVLELPDGLDTRCGERGSGLSEGQAQRIAIARGLLGRGSMLILDEPSAALDRDTERRLLDNLREIARTRTVVIVSHSHAIVTSTENVVRISSV